MDIIRLFSERGNKKEGGEDNPRNSPLRCLQIMGKS